MYIDFISLLGLLLDIEVNLQPPAWEILQFFSVHFKEGCLGRGMLLEADICETLGMSRLPILRYSDLLNLTKWPEPITNIVFFKFIW